MSSNNFKLSKSSLENLIECVPELIELITAVSKDYNLTVTCGHRNEKDQEDCFNRGVSKAHFGQSPHNCFPSYAVDVVPYPTKWSDVEKQKELVKLIKEQAAIMNIKITCGADFKSFTDLPHIEIKDWKVLHAKET